MSAGVAGDVLSSLLDLAEEKEVDPMPSKMNSIDKEPGFQINDNSK